MRGLLGIISNSMLDSDTRKFRRIYVFLGALKSGFKARKRELLGLNGCFMSGPYPGQVLIAVGVNPNNGTYPLAYAMVESETKDSWRWFLDSLGYDLELFRNSNFTFVTGKPKCDVLLNNMCKVLNRQILDGRDKPVITLPGIYQTISQEKEAAQYIVTWYRGDLYQAVGPHRDQCVCNMNLRTCSCKKWKLTGMPCKYAVASIWNMASNGLEAGIPESWVSECFWLSTWQEMYRFKINPCNGPDMLKKSPSLITLTPPDYHTSIGRPLKKRKISDAELFDVLVRKGKLGKVGKLVTCTKPVAPFVTPRFTKNTTNMLSPIKNTPSSQAAVTGKE
ncbi:mutator type transposase [Tanacetum coccineum]